MSHPFDKTFWLALLVLTCGITGVVVLAVAIVRAVTGGAL